MGFRIFKFLSILQPFAFLPGTRRPTTYPGSLYISTFHFFDQVSSLAQVNNMADNDAQVSLPELQDFAHLERDPTV